MGPINIFGFVSLDWKCFIYRSLEAVPAEFSSFLFLYTMQEANKPPDSWFELKVNTHVYVTGLPDDATVDEVSHSYYFILYENMACGLELI